MNDVRIVNDRVVTRSIGTISRDPQAAYLVGAYREPGVRELLEIKRMSSTTVRFVTSLKTKRYVTSVRLSQSVGTELRLLGGFDINKDGIEDVAVVDAS